MKKLVSLISLFFLTIFCIFAQSKQMQTDNWIDAYVKEKSKIRTTLKKANMPIRSSWIKAGQKPETIVADLKGQDKLVLVTSGGPDGRSWDWSVWTNVRLIKTDGTSVWLDELEPVYKHSTEASVRKNVNHFGKPISIGDKTYEHGMFCHSDGIMIFDINKQFARFEAEVGIDNESKTGSVYFSVLNTYPKEDADKLLKLYPDQLNALVGNSGKLETLLISPGISYEKDASLSLISKLKDSSYFRHLFNQAELGNDEDKQIRSYLELFENASRIIAIQNDLDWLNIEAIRLAFIDMQKNKGYNVSKYQPMMDELEQLVRKGFDGIYRSDETALLSAEKALDIKRTILLGNSLLDGDKIIAARFKLGANARTAMAPELGTQANNWSNQQSASRKGHGADIVELINLRGDIETRSVFKPANSASIADLKLHWDGDRVMFTSIMPDNRWNVFEVKLDGSGFKPLMKTEEPELEFYDGTYLPDGRIIVNSNIGYHGVPCVNGGDPVGNMVLYDPAKDNMRRLTFDQDANWNPVIMHNGRVMYTRWEYTDLTHYFSRMVMHMNPDGTENKALFGSGEMFPNSTFDMQPLPGHSSAFVGIISGHHGIARSGRIILFDPMKARKGVQGMIQEIPHRNREIIPEIKDELVNGVWPQFIKPYPLDDKYFLVTAKLSPDDLWGMYLVDVFDNVTCLMKQEGEGFISPIIVRKTEIPPAIPDRVKLDEKEATVFIQDIYEGEGLRGVPKGTIKELRIHGYEYAYLNTRSDHYAQGIQSGWDIKRLLGTVPIEEDGSVIFKVPANTPISIQPLDKDGAAVQWMRSWFTGMPGEIVSCVGCHEDQNQIPIPKRVAASQKAPMRLTMPEGGVRSFTFDLEVQPILDRACVSCHNGEKGGMNLNGGEKDKMGFGTSYLALHPYVRRQGPEADMPVLQPYEYHPNTSELVRMLKKGHYNVELTEEEWRSLYNWIDYNAPDKGYFDAINYDGFPYKGFNQYERRIELNDKYANESGVDWRKEIEDYAGYLKTKGKPEPESPKKMEPMKTREIKVKGWPFGKDKIEKMLSDEKESRKKIEIASGVKINFVRIPAGEFVMGSNTRESDVSPISKVKINKSFWMGEIEITNDQYKALVPEHDSRYVDQFWKDHTRPGYEANRPEQPVIRVSYEDALEYCEKLSKKTGLNITLPTEAQWEWACRAGSDSDFWYGDRNTDFSKYENMADAQLSNMAVSGIDPQPMSKNDFWFPYYNYLPKEASVDDGNMNQVDSKLYEANPFGLYSMHGNIAEWTCSDYLPYPYSEKSKKHSEYKVVRGGSYLDRPKFSTAYTRKAYYPWQRVFNVGFRVIIED
ncbi:MAG: SUMF1/EgtB/PvdO family nonheme iron enzyme [Prevotella sp.]|jgi:formylglycine-generating enzyme required for sulfatase activity|nr:SUMF1/EgtB/PvdO family nonheme iron enzyme [Prevotella sp.]